MVFVPIMSGIFPVFQFASPVAVPEPMELVHVTLTRPTVLVAAPDTVMVEADVPTLVEAGDVMVSDAGAGF
jgi:hypothetical protein